jgi:hypothetical protein
MVRKICAQAASAARPAAAKTTARVAAITIPGIQLGDIVGEAGHDCVEVVPVETVEHLPGHLAIAFGTHTTPTTQHATAAARDSSRLVGALCPGSSNPRPNRRTVAGEVVRGCRVDRSGCCEADAAGDSDCRRVRAS